MLEKIHSIQANENIKKIASACFYLGLFIELAMVIVDKSNYTNPFEGRLFQITFVLFFIKLLLSEFNLKEYICIFLFCVFGLFVDTFSDRNEILRMAVFVFSMKNVNVNKAMKLTLWVTLLGSLAIMLLSIFGIYGEMKVVKEYEGIGNVTRYAFGMGNANAFHCMYFVILLLIFYLYYSKMPWWIYLASCVLNLLIYFLTDSRTSTVLCMALVILFGILRLAQRKKMERLLSVFSVSCIISYLSMIALSVYFAYDTWKIFYKRLSIEGAPERSLIYIIDRALTGRISTLSGSDGWKGSISSWSFLPTKGNTDYFDLGYVRLFYWYGILAALIILAVILCLLMYLCVNKKYTELLMLTVIGIYTLIEAHFVSVYIGRCYPLFILGIYIFDMLNPERKDEG